MSKIYNLNGYAGLVETRRNRHTRLMVSVYHNEQAGFDCGCTRGANTELGDGHNPEHHNPFSTVCEEHGEIIIHRTLALAKSHAAMPEWCSVCQEILEKKGLI